MSKLAFMHRALLPQPEPNRISLPLAHVSQPIGPSSLYKIVSNAIAVTFRQPNSSALINRFKIEIYDLLGRQIFDNNYEAGNNLVKIDYNDIILSNNFVIVRIADGNTTVNKKVIMMK